jgi:hypothetical protein
MKISQGSRNSPARTGLALVALALGAAAVGAFAIGALAIGRIAIRRGRIDKLTIGELTVDKLVVREHISVDRDENRSRTRPNQTGFSTTTFLLDWPATAFEDVWPDRHREVRSGKSLVLAEDSLLLIACTAGMVPWSSGNMSAKSPRSQGLTSRLEPGPVLTPMYPGSPKTGRFRRVGREQGQPAEFGYRRHGSG